MGQIPWMSKELLEWFKTRGWTIDCDTRRCYVNGTRSYCLPNPEFFKDRITLLYTLHGMLNQVRAMVARDKRAAAELN